MPRLAEHLPLGMDRFLSHFQVLPLPSSSLILVRLIPIVFLTSGTLASKGELTRDDRNARIVVPFPL